MSENVPEPHPATQSEPQVPSPPGRTRWRDRAWSLPVVIAVALVAVLLGGLGGAALASVGDREGGGRGPGFHRFPGGGPPMPGRQQRQWDRRQQPGGPFGPIQPYGNGTSPAPALPTPSS